MRRKKTKKIVLVILLLILVLLISVGYAVLSTNVTINGTSTLKKQSWNIYFDNVRVIEKSETATQAPITNGTITTELSWGVSLDTPGQFYEFDVDIVNSGSIDAMIDTETNSIVTSALTEEQKAYLEYTIKYKNGTQIEQYDRLAAGETKTITVKLLFKEDINPSDLPSTTQTISLSYTTNYIQADNRAVTKATQIEPLKIGDTVNYTTSLNGQTLNNWKVFYIDGDYTYIILGDYLPNAAVSGLSGIVKGAGSYNLKATSNRIQLLNAMETKSNWDSLLTGTLDGKAINETRTENIWAMGSPTLELYVKSWNASYPNYLIYTKKGPVAADGLVGYYIGTSENPNGASVNMSSQEGYNNTLYYPHHELLDECRGYWLASTYGSNMSVNYQDIMMGVLSSGDIAICSIIGSNGNAFRPVICLPSSIINP